MFQNYSYSHILWKLLSWPNFLIVAGLNSLYPHVHIFYVSFSNFRSKFYRIIYNLINKWWRNVISNLHYSSGHILWQLLSTLINILRVHFSNFRPILYCVFEIINRSHSKKIEEMLFQNYTTYLRPYPYFVILFQFFRYIMYKTRCVGPYVKL